MATGTPRTRVISTKLTVRWNLNSIPMVQLGLRVYGLASPKHPSSETPELEF